MRRVAASTEAPHSFVIITDNATFDACADALDAYKQAVENEGLATHIVASDWQSPEEVKSVLQEYYSECGLDGAVFVGNVPIAMIRRAQHMTSAFKNDSARRRYVQHTSVPSDRFYDDFDLPVPISSRQDTLGASFFTTI